MAGETQVTIIGNVVSEPQLRFTSTGTPVLGFRIASTPRQFNKNTQQWEDKETLFLSCSVWRQQAENAAETLMVGMRVIVYGTLKSRTYDSNGEKRTVFEVDVEEVGPSLKSASAKVNKTQRQGGGGGGGFGGGQQSDGFGGGQGGGFGQQGQQPPANDPWASGGGGGGYRDQNPPF